MKATRKATAPPAVFKLSLNPASCSSSSSSELLGIKMCLLSCLSFYLCSFSKLLELLFFKRSYSGFGFMILYFSISGITFGRGVLILLQRRDISSFRILFNIVAKKDICPALEPFSILLEKRDMSTFSL